MDPSKARERISRFGPVQGGGGPLPLMGGQQGGFGGPGVASPGLGPGPPTPDMMPVKKGLVNDPMAGLGGPGGPPPGWGGGPPPGQWGPMGGQMMGPGGPMGPGWGAQFGHGGPMGGMGGPMGGMGGPMGNMGGPPMGQWGPRPPFPPNMMCVSQGNSGKPCRHFQRGTCTYGNRLVRQLLELF